VNGSEPHFDPEAAALHRTGLNRCAVDIGDRPDDRQPEAGFLVGVNDAQDPSGTDQVTAPGYDTMTGLGTPNGRAFIKGLRSGK
jgi:hypothetical protein